MIDLGQKQTLIEFDYYISPDGKEYELSDGATKFLLGGLGGLGMPGISYLSEQAPFQHGITLTDYRFQPRTIQMLLRLQSDSRQGYWDSRAEIINILRPNRQVAGQFNAGTLRKVLPDGTIRDIDVLIDQGLSFGMRSTNQWDEFGFSELIRLLAPNPMFYDPTEEEVLFESEALDNLVFPITFPIIFGSTVIAETQIVSYQGTFKEFPIIEIDGPLNAPAIYNDTTGEYIQVIYNVPEGDVLTINLADRYKTVTNLAGENLQGTVEGDLGTWHLAADPEATDGLNTIRVTGNGASPGHTAVRLLYHNRYLGL